MPTPAHRHTATPTAARAHIAALAARAAQAQDAHQFTRALLCYSEAERTARAAHITGWIFIFRAAQARTFAALDAAHRAPRHTSTARQEAKNV